MRRCRRSKVLSAIGMVFIGVGAGVLGLIGLVAVGLVSGTLDGWLLLLAFGIIHLHVDHNIAAVGWWVAWPLGIIASVLFASSKSKEV